MATSSACTATHLCKPSPDLHIDPGHGTSVQCGIPLGTALYPVDSMFPFMSTKTQPTSRLMQVARVLITLHISKYHESRSGRTLASRPTRVSQACSGVHPLFSRSLTVSNAIPIASDHSIRLRLSPNNTTILALDLFLLLIDSVVHLTFPGS